MMTSAPASFQIHTNMADVFQLTMQTYIQVTGPRFAVLAHGLRPRTNKADLGPISGPIQNSLINNIIEYSMLAITDVGTCMLAKGYIPVTCCFEVKVFIAGFEITRWTVGYLIDCRT